MNKEIKESFEEIKEKYEVLKNLVHVFEFEGEYFIKLLNCESVNKISKKEYEVLK